MPQEQTYATYPRMDIDPRKKDLAWGMQYCKAAWFDWCYTWPRTVFYNAADKYEELRLYAIGKQPINKYKKLMGVDEQTNMTYLNLDWSVRPVICQKRDVAISKMIQQGHTIVATPIDPTAKAELDKFFAMAKAKIAMRQLMEQQNPQLAQHPMLQPEPGEPLDWEEMQMRIDFGEQFNRAKDAEEAIQLGFYENSIDQFVQKLFEDVFDLGVAGYREGLGKNNKPYFRNVNPEAVITNYCKWADFRDLIHAGEAIDVSVIELAELTDENGKPVFTEEQIKEIINSVAGKWSNPSMIGRSTNYFKGYDRMKAKVLDLEWYSYNDYHYKIGQDSRGNTRVKKEDYKAAPSDKVTTKRIKVVYCCKWVIGTDYAYDFYLKEDMKRAVDPTKKADTQLSYRFIATNFYEMRALGMMERLVPLIDSYQLDVYNVQNIANRIVPNGWWIDLDALENVALNKGGENMKPIDLLQMFMETGVLVGRSQGVMGDNVNYKPIIPIQNSIASELVAYYQKMEMTLNQMNAMIGLNEITDATTPNPKLLNGVATMMDQGTNNSLFPMIAAKKNLMTRLANDVLIRIQQGLRKGGISGYAPALNTNTLKFIQLSEELCLRDYGIVLEDKPTDEQKQMLMQQMQFDIQNGFLDSSDVFYIINIYNVKQAQQMLAFRAKRNKQAIEQAKQAAAAQTIQGQQQTAVLSAQAQQQLEMIKHRNAMELQTLKGQQSLEEIRLKMGMQAATTTETNQTKIATQMLQNDSQEKMQKRDMGMPEEEGGVEMEKNIPEEAMM